MKKKILYITTIGSTMNFFISLISELIKEGNVVDIATNTSIKPVPSIYQKLGCKIYHMPFTRRVFDIKKMIESVSKIKKIVADGRYDIVHCHTPIASVCARLACKKLRKTSNLKVIYTAHGFHFYKGAPKKNWILYYPIERFCSRFTDVLITINNEDYEFAKKHMKAKRIEYVPGVGIDIDKFKNCKVDVEKKRKELGIPKDAFLILSVGELIKRKNHKVVLDALAKLNDQNIFYIIAGEGALKKFLLDYANKLGIQNNFKLLGYRSDTPELYKCADLVIHPSIHEGLPVALMEAYVSDCKIIASNIRGNNDIILEKYLFNNSYKEVYNLIIDIVSNNSTQAKLNKDFSCEKVNYKLLRFYE